MGNWTVEQIVETYDLTLAECVGCLTRLDRRRIIELQPGNRIRPLISRTFSWLPDGPIQRYFRSRVEAEYLGGKFDRPEELFVFVSGMLSRQSAEELIVRLRRTAREFAELHQDDLALPIPAASRHEHAAGRAPLGAAGVSCAAPRRIPVTPRRLHCRYPPLGWRQRPPGKK